MECTLHLSQMLAFAPPIVCEFKSRVRLKIFKTCMQDIQESRKGFLRIVRSFEVIAIIIFGFLRFSDEQNRLPGPKGDLFVFWSCGTG